MGDWCAVSFYTTHIDNKKPALGGVKSYWCFTKEHANFYGSGTTGNALVVGSSAARESFLKDISALVLRHL